MHVVITGANRGIGKELATRYEQQGHSVTKTARTPGEGFAQLDIIPIYKSIDKENDLSGLLSRGAV